MEEVSRRTSCAPLASPCLCFLCLEAEGFLAFEGRRGMISVVRWNLRHTRCRNKVNVAHSPVNFGWAIRILTSFFCTSFLPCLFHLFHVRRKIHLKKATQYTKVIWTCFFRIMSAGFLLMRKAGRSSRKLFEKVRGNMPCFLVFLDFGWVFLGL